MNCFNKKKSIVFIIILINTAVYSQTAHKMLRQGDASYRSEDYKTAEENYRKSLEAESSAKGNFNLGNTIFKQQRYDDAIKQYDAIASKINDRTLKFNSLYNKGNAHFWKKEYDKAVDAYKEALRLNPNDVDAKTNLAKAKKMVQEQQKQQQKQQDQQQNQKDKNQQKNNKEDQNEQQNQSPQDEQPKQNQQQNQEPDKQPEQNPQKQSQQDLNKEDAKRMLQIMDDEERKVQKRLKKGKPKPSRSTKDW